MGRPQTLSYLGQLLSQKESTGDLGWAENRLTFFGAVSKSIRCLALCHVAAVCLSKSDWKAGAVSKCPGFLRSQSFPLVSQVCLLLFHPNLLACEPDLRPVLLGWQWFQELSKSQVAAVAWAKHVRKDAVAPQESLNVSLFQEEAKELYLAATADRPMLKSLREEDHQRSLVQSYPSILTICANKCKKWKQIKKDVNINEILFSTTFLRTVRLHMGPSERLTILISRAS